MQTKKMWAMYTQAHLCPCSQPHCVYVILDICMDQQKSCGKSRFTRLKTQVRIHFSDGSGYTIEVFACKNSFHVQPVYPEKVFPYVYHEISCKIT